MPEGIEGEFQVSHNFSTLINLDKMQIFQEIFRTRIITFFHLHFHLAAFPQVNELFMIQGTVFCPQKLWKRKRLSSRSLLIRVHLFEFLLYKKENIRQCKWDDQSSISKSQSTQTLNLYCRLQKIMKNLEEEIIL